MVYDIVVHEGTFLTVGRIFSEDICGSLELIYFSLIWDARFEQSFYTGDSF